MSSALTSRPLYAIEETLSALLESVETCPDELRGELEVQITSYIGAEIAKVDRVAEALAVYEWQAKARRDEAKRLTEEARKIEAAKERLEEYVVRVMESSGKRKLEGRVAAFALRSSDAVVVLDASAIPAEYKRTTVTVDVDKVAVKKAIKAGATVAGADLAYRESLVRK